LRKAIKDRGLVLVVIMLMCFRLGIAGEITKSVKVIYFFPKDGDQNPSSNPNWYYYWSQFIPRGRITIHMFDNSISGYASTDVIARTTRVSQRASEYNDETTHRGIHTFYETLAHESHHIVLWEGWWPSGYNSSNDSDSNTYPDSWEQTDPEAILFGFLVGQDDSYSIPNSAGYRYEETKCRQVEHAIDETAYDSQDWSYDPTGVNQGKMWLKLP